MYALGLTLILVFSPVRTCRADGRTASIVKAVADWYGINCVVLFRNGRDTKETEDLFRILKFSTDHMDMIEIKDLEEQKVAYTYNHDRCSRMLHVIDDRSNNSRTMLEQLSHSVILGGPVWFVFLPGTITPAEYLKNTSIPFDAEFIVAETDEEIFRLDTVYRVSLSHALRITPVGYWTEDANLVVDRYCPHWRRNDLEGTVIRVSAIENWPLTVITENHVEGFFGKVWRDLEERLNFSTTYVKPKGSGIGVWNGEAWNGLMGMTVRGEIDAVISEVKITTDRLDVVDYLIPLYVTRYQIFFKPPGLQIQWDLVFRPFQKEVWIALALWSGIATLLLVACHKIAVSYGLEDLKRQAEYQYFFLVVSAFCQQANTVMPKSIGCRLIIATMYLFSMVIVIIYSCTLASMIATQKPVLPFDSLETFLDDGTYTLEQIPGTDSYAYFSNSTDSFLQEIYRTLFSKLPDEKLPKSHKEALKRVCEKEKTAYFGEFGVAIASANRISQNERCPITVLQNFLKPLHLTMAVTKDSPYKDALNYQLSQMFNTGILLRFRHISFPLWGKFQTVSVSPVTGEQLAQVNLLFFIAVVVSVCAFLVELAKSKSNRTTDADNKRNI